MSKAFATTTCDCGEVITSTADEVLTFETVECPNCGTDVYYAEGLYEKALSMSESNILVDGDSGCSNYINMDLQQLIKGN